MHKKIAIGFATLLASGAMAQDGATFKVYGFADMEFNKYVLSNSFATNFIGTDTMKLSQTHANLYFDFHPNEHIKGLIEVGLLSQPKYTKFENGSDPAILTYQGQNLTNAQIKSLVVEQQVAQQVASMAKSGAPQAMIDASTPAIRAAIAPKVDSALGPKLDSLRMTIAGNSVEDKRAFSLDRAQFDIAINDNVNIRVGKWITPAGIWNVDHASPVILTVRQPIQTTTIPVFPESQLGLMSFGNIAIGDQDLSYSLYTSSGRIDGASTQLDASNGASLNSPADIAYGGHVGLKLDVLKSIKLGASYFNGAVNHKYSSLEINSTIEDFLAGKPTKAVMNDHYISREREWAVGGDAKLEVSNILVQGEVNYRKRNNEIGTGSSEVLGWYGLVSWTQPLTANISVAPYAMYEDMSSTLEGRATGAFNDGGIEGLRTMILGVNTTFYTNYHLKLEYTNVQFVKDPTTWMFSGVSDEDININAWSAQIAVAF